MKPEILTVSGNYFNFEDPASSEFDIVDIAHALSKICRFGGHTTRFYSVAQHSVLVSRIMPPGMELHGLLHDAAEAFLGDIPTPLKQLLPHYSVLESNAEKAIFRKFGLDMKEAHHFVKHADLRLLATEDRDLMPEHGDTWELIKNIPPLDERIKPWGPAEAKRNFLGRYMGLAG